MKSYLIFLLLALFAGAAAAEPTVLVMPFDPIIDTVYGYWGEKESALNYGSALQQMISSELSQRLDLRTIEPARLQQYINEQKLEAGATSSIAEASYIGTALGADYVVIGTYGEFTREIRVDSRIIVTAAGEIPQGYSVTTTVSNWEDLPTAATLTAQQLIPLLTAGGRIRPYSRAVLIPEGDLAAYDPAGTTAPGQSRLIVWVNTPAPQIQAGAVEFRRCERVDLMYENRDRLKSDACRVAVVPAGTVRVSITQRGFLPYEQDLNLAPGKAYRLEVSLERIEQHIAR